MQQNQVYLKKTELTRLRGVPYTNTHSPLFGYTNTHTCGGAAKVFADGDHRAADAGAAAGQSQMLNVDLQPLDGAHVAAVLELVLGLVPVGGAVD